MFTLPSRFQSYPSFASAAAFNEVLSAFERLTDRTFNGPDAVPVDVWASDEALAITVEVPGVRKEDLAIEATADTISISGTRSRPEEPAKPAAAEQTRVLVNERSGQRFSRTVSLPWRVAPDQVEARLVDGVLTIGLKRAESDKRRTITVAA